MFKNIGKKIKTLSKVLFWVGLVLVALMLLVPFLSAETANTSPTTILLAMIPSLIIIFIGLWLSALLMYGFGELIEKTQQNNQYLAQIAANTAKEN
ncbi:MAG: hypothetical protein IJ350_03110 [Clostridia bacterium]|nr:hypothetical protein [Clostridia bacterium]